jgi:hypothetical protein
VVEAGRVGVAKPVGRFHDGKADVGEQRYGWRLANLVAKGAKRGCLVS